LGVAYVSRFVNDALSKSVNALSLSMIDRYDYLVSIFRKVPNMSDSRDVDSLMPWMA
jgi:glycyl-tRNA synthetase beta subunit